MLGTGGLIYEAINILVFANCPAECQFKAKLLSACSAIVFMVLEITLLLNYSRVSTTMFTFNGVFLLLQSAAQPQYPDSRSQDHCTSVKL